MSTILMYDAVPEGVPFIPADAKAVAGYVDGNFRSFPLLVQRFGGRAHCVSIGVFLGHLAEFTDVEPGNPINTPALVRADFLHRRLHGVWKPGYYADKTRMETQVLPGLEGIPRSEYRLILADWDGVEDFSFFDGAKKIRDDSEQFRSLAHYDISVVNVETFFPPTVKHKGKPSVHKVVSKVKKIHPKVKAAVPSGGAGVGIASVLTHAGIHLTSAESAAIGAALAILAAYFKSSGAQA